MSELEKAEREYKRLAEVRALFEDRGNAKTDWRANLRWKGESILGDAHNVRLALEHAPELVDLVSLNELSHRIELRRAPPWRALTRGRLWCDDDDIELACYLQQWRVPVRADVTIPRLIHAHAAAHPFHPVREWLSGLPMWDGEPRLAEVLMEVLCAQGNGEYLSGVLRRFMISAVARAMRPGCKCDHMLVLVGEQGARKSSFALSLGSPWAVESNSTFGTKDAIAELEGAWIVEVGELAGLRRSEVETIKHFISRQVDRYRPAYGRNVVDQPRACVFIGTTNEEKFLLDYSGNRRFWPLRCAGRVNLRLLESERAALWAEALAAYHAGEQWFLTEGEEALATTAQEAHRVVTEVEQDVAAHLDLIIKESWRAEKTTTVREVYQAIAGERERENLSARRQMETAIGQAIRRCGWVYVGRVGAERRTTYRAPLNQSDNPDNH